MHSDQLRKDGISEPMIQALYYDFVTNYVKTRMYSTRYVECNSGATIPVKSCFVRTENDYIDIRLFRLSVSGR